MPRILSPERCTRSPEGAHDWAYVHTLGQPTQICTRCHALRAFPPHEPDWIFVPAAPGCRTSVAICAVCGMTTHPDTDGSAQIAAFHLTR